MNMVISIYAIYVSVWVSYKSKQAADLVDCSETAEEAQKHGKGTHTD